MALTSEAHAEDPVFHESAEWVAHMNYVREAKLRVLKLLQESRYQNYDLRRGLYLNVQVCIPLSLSLSSSFLSCRLPLPIGLTCLLRIVRAMLYMQNVYIDIGLR